MSVGLGTLKTVGNVGARQIEVLANNYDGDELWLSASGENCEVELTLDRRQMMELSVIIDRFLDHD